MTEAFRVVVVEDDPDVAAYTKTVLEKRGGFDVRTTGDPFAAKQLVTEFDPDVVVTDVEMPGMTGLELLDQIRAGQPQLPVIVMTAHISVEYAVAALRSQADEFLTKPINAAELVSMVKRLAADSRANRQAARPREHVLAIGAHPSDVEIGVGGILAAHRAAGDSVTILTLSQGSRGGLPTDSQRESLDSSEMLGARLFLESLSAIEIEDVTKTAAIIERVVAEIKPTAIYTHSVHDENREHRAVYEATLVGAPGVRMVACYHSTSATAEFTPSSFVSIDDFTETKIALTKCFSSQTENREYLDTEQVLATARHWGGFSGSTNVEPLELLETSANFAE